MMFSSTDLKYVNVDIIVTIKLKEIDTTTIPLILVPAQIINIGAKAVFGKAFNTIKQGSSIFDNNGNKYKSVAIINPINVPSINPNIVSITEIRICGHRVLDLIYSNNNVTIAEGLETKKELIKPILANSSHININKHNKDIWTDNTNQYLE